VNRTHGRHRNKEALMATKKTGTTKNSAPGGSSPRHIEVDHVNAVILVGEVARDAVATETQDGRTFVSFDVVCRIDGERTVVPVSQEGAISVGAGQTVAVVGHAAKRFFASGTGLASRTDVRADKVVLVRRRDQIQRTLATFIGELPGA
jgi:hypothetical protein